MRVIRPLLALAVGLLLAPFVAPLSVWATDLNKSNSLTIDKDSTAGSWTATCDISVSGVDQHQIYSGIMLFQFAPEGAGSATNVFNVLFQVDPTDRVWTESSSGIYSVKATLQGRQVAVHAEVSIATINPGDRIFCGSRIDPGTQPPVVGTTLFGANMQSTVQQP